MRARPLRGGLGAQLGGTAVSMLAILLASALPARAQVQAYVVDGDALAVIDTETHAVVDRVPLLGGASDLAVSLDGETAYAVHWRQLAIIDLHAGVIRAVLPIWGEDPPDERIRLSAAGDRAYLFDVAFYEHPAIFVFDTVAREFLAPIRLPVPTQSWTQDLLDFALSGDGRRAYAIMRIDSEPGEALWLYEIDTASGTVVSQTPAQNGVAGYGASAAIAPERGVAYVNIADAILAIDLATGRVVRRVPFGGYALLVWDSDGQRLFASSFARGEAGAFTELVAIDADTGRALELAQFDWWPRDVAVAPGSDALYVTVSGPAPRTVVVDAASGSVTAIVPTDHDPGALAFGQRPASVPLSTATARPSPTPAALRSYRALAVSGATRTLAEIDTAAPAVVRTSGDPALAGVRDLVALPDGRILYGVAYQELIAIDATSGAIADRIEIEGAWNGLVDVAVAPDGATLWVAGTYTAAWVIDPHALSVLGSVEMKMNEELTGQELAPDGRRLYMTGRQSTADDRDAGYLHIVDPAARRLLRSIELPAGAADVVVSADGGLAYVVTGGSVTVVDTATERVAAIVPLPGPAEAIALSADGGFAYVIGGAPWNETRPVLSVLDTGALRRVATIPVAESGVGRRIVLTPDGQRALVGIDGPVGRVVVVDLSRLEVVSVLRVGVAPLGLAVVPGAWQPPPSPTPRPRRSPGALRPCMLVPQGAGSAPADGTITLIDPTRHAVAGSIRVGQLSGDASAEGIYDGVRGVAADPDGTLLYAIVQPLSGGAGYLAAIDTTARAVVDTLYVGLEPWALAVTGDGARAFVLNLGSYYDSTLSLVDLRAWRALDDVLLPEAYGGLYFSSDGRHLYVRRHSYVAGERTDVLTAIDTTTLAVAFEVPLSAERLGSGGLAVIPDGRTLLIDTTDGGLTADVIGVIDLGTRAVSDAIEVPVTSWSHRYWGGSTFAVSPDGREVYRTSGASPGTVAVVDVAARRVVDQIPVQASLNSPAFTPDGAFVYAASGPSDVAVIDVATRRLVSEIALSGYAGGLVGAMIDAPCDALPVPPATPIRTATAGGPNARPTPKPTSTPTGSVAWIELAVGSATSEPGTTVAVEVRLSSGGHDVAGVQIEVAFRSPVEIAAGADGRPACRVNPDIGKQASAFVFWPIGCLPGGCLTVRALVVALDSVDPIPDGSVLFTCDVTIAAEAAADTYRLHPTSLGASDPDGNALPALGVAGTVTVVSAASRAARAGLRHDAGGTCAIGPPAAGAEGWWIIAVFGLLAVRRRWARSSGRTRLRHQARHELAGDRKGIIHETKEMTFTRPTHGAGVALARPPSTALERLTKAGEKGARPSVPALHGCDGGFVAIPGRRR